MAVSDEQGQAFFGRAKRDLSKIAEGFSVLVQQDESVLDAIASYTKRVIDPSYPLPSASEASAEMKVSGEILIPITAATNMLVGALYSPSPPFTVDGLLAGAVQHGFIQPEEQGAVGSFVEKHLSAHSEAIRDAIFRERAALFTIPTYSSLDVTTDIRVIRHGGKNITMPMALVMLRTDVEEKQLVFQMTLRDVVQVQKYLEGVIERLSELRRVRLGSEGADGPA